MKYEKVMLDNGNCEEVPVYIQHKCYSPNYEWYCEETMKDIGNLYMCFEDEYNPVKFKVNFCSFCGYKSSNKKGN